MYSNFKYYAIQLLEFYRIHKINMLLLTALWEILLILSTMYFNPVDQYKYLCK